MSDTPPSTQAEQEPSCPPEQGTGAVVRRSLGGVEWESQRKLTAALQAGLAIEAVTCNGSISLIGRDQEGCEVEATIRAKASSERRARQLAGETKVALVHKDDRLYVDVQEPKTPGLESVCVSLKIAVPRKTLANLRATNGRIQVADLDGSVTCKADNGRIDLRQIVGRSDLVATNGAVIAEQLSGDCSACADNGQVKIDFADGASGNCDLRASNGRIICRNLRGTLQAHADNGSVEAAYAATACPACSATIIAENGSIRLTMPLDPSAQVSASAANGRIRTKLPLTVKGDLTAHRIEGQLGKGLGKVRLQASNGQIQIE